MCGCALVEAFRMILQACYVVILACLSLLCIGSSFITLQTGSISVNKTFHFHTFDFNFNQSHLVFLVNKIALHELTRNLNQ